MSTVGYKAFVTYSHEDTKTAAWLQRAIEGYRVPPSLSTSTAELGNAVPRRLRPIFRDRVELSAGSNLSQTISGALTNSQFLIVICSPAACRSQWVNLEIAEFRRVHGDERILCLIVEGEPFGSGKSGKEHLECFPAALGFRHDLAHGDTSGVPEPVAADLRPGGDGKRQAKLKIIAGLLGVGLDRLVQRDTLRRHRRMAGLSAISITGMIVMAVLSLVAIDARNGEQLRRTQAEELIEFMLSDLRERLEAVGRLDVLDAVGREAIRYYSSVSLEEHTADALGRRARAFHLLGEVDDLRGNLDAARVDFDEAFDSTGELLRRTPDDGSRIYDHAQSVFWVGYLDWQLGDLNRAETAFQKYISLAVRLVDIDSSRLDWLAELGYATINMGVYKLETGSPHEAITFFDDGRQIFEKATSNDPQNLDWKITLAQAHAWTADAQRNNGALSRAREHRRIEANIYHEILEISPQNQDVNQTLLVSHKARGKLSMYQGDIKAAVDDYREARRYGDNLLALDPENTFTVSIAAANYAELAEALFYSGQFDEPILLLNSARELMASLLAKDPDVLDWQLEARMVDVRLGRYLQRMGDHDDAIPILLDTVNELNRLTTENPDVVKAHYFLADASFALSSAYKSTASHQAQQEMLALAMGHLVPYKSELPVYHLALLASVYGAAGKTLQARAIAAEPMLTAFRHPQYAVPRQ